VGRKTPTVWVANWGEMRAALRVPGRQEGEIELDTPAWQAWLEAPNTHSFAYPIYDRREGYIRGFMTVRKERRARGGWYWVVYRRSGGQLHKIYLGRSERVRQERLAGVAERMMAQGQLPNEM
jgi:LuxR family maltose regulon positive regulatory protein